MPVRVNHCDDCIAVAEKQRAQSAGKQSGAASPSG
jgi:hypothetical protein